MTHDAQIERFDEARKRLLDAEQVLADARADYDAAKREFVAAGAALAERCRMTPPPRQPQLALGGPDLDSRPWSATTR